MRKIALKTLDLANGETLSYRYFAGGDKIIVLVHGNLASSAFYDELMESLPEDFTVYAVDMRGFGQSTYHRPIDTLRDLAGDLKLFVDQLGLDQFDLLGWSTGGAVSMFFCSSYGERVKRLFLVGSAAGAGYKSYGQAANGDKVQLQSRQAFLQDPAKQEMLAALNNHDKAYYKAVWQKAIYNINQPAEDIFDKHLEESLLQKNLMDIYYGLSQFNISDSYNGVSVGTEETKRLKLPVHIIHGRQDLLISVEEITALKEAIGDNARLTLIDQCGHSPMVDAPDILRKAIIEA